MSTLASFVRRHLPFSGSVTESSTTQPSQGEEVKLPPAQGAAIEGQKSLQADSGGPSSTKPSDSDAVSVARAFPLSGFELVEPSVKLEEEGFPWYSAKKFYPARIGQVLQGSYQIVAKLGYGTASTTWLCRDLKKHRYVTVKIYAAGQEQKTREIAALEHIDSVLAASPRTRHVGSANIRTLLDKFEVAHPKTSRNNLCLVFDPLGMSLADTRKLLFGGKLDLDLVQGVVFYLLRALDFLHRKANLVHADIQEDNILLALSDGTELEEIEQGEMEDPCPRKIYKDHTIYSSRLVAIAGTAPVFCDFGEARFGETSYAEHAMPDLYRPPEILLGLAWDEKIDIWGLGLVMWTLVEGTNLFTDNKGGRRISAIPHMARMISLLGPPPQELLDSTWATKDFFDKHGKLKKGHQVVETSLEAEMNALDGGEKEEFLRFLRRFLQWEPEKRPSARELLSDPWLTPPKRSSSEDEAET